MFCVITHLFCMLLGSSEDFILLYRKERLTVLYLSMEIGIHERTTAIS